MNISIVIPILNEAKQIGGLIDRLKSKGYNAIVIDDGSTDGCGEIAKGRGAFVIRHEQRQGKGKSLQNGFTHAVNEGYAGVIAMDGDGQHDVDDIKAMLDVAEAHPDSVVCGNRMADAKDMPLIRKATNWFMSSLISVICKQKIPDTQCGFRYIGTDVLKHINLTCNAFEIETEVLIKASRAGYKIYSSPIKTIYRDEDSKINPIKDTARFFMYVMRELFSKRS